MRLAIQIGSAAILSILGIVLSAGPADAGCGCDKPPPPLAQVRPNVAYVGAPVSLFGPSLKVGAAYTVTFTSGVPSTLASTATVSAVVANLRDLGDGVYKPQLVVPVPPLPLGPARITAVPVAGDAPGILIPDTSFTVAPMPMAVPTDTDEYHFPGYQAAVGRDGVVYFSLDLTNVQQPMVFEAQLRGYAMRFGGDDVLFYNVQGFLMQRLMQIGPNDAEQPVPGMFVFPAANPATDSDALHYSRHEFDTYFLQHQERLPHSVDPTDPNWHLDGSRHVDHNHLIVAVVAHLNDGSLPTPGATPPFDLVVDTYSLFYQGLVGAGSVTLMNYATTDSYDSTTGARGSHGDVLTNGLLTLSGSAVLNGNATAGSFVGANTTRLTGKKTTVATPGTFMEVKVPTMLTNLGSLDVREGGATIVGPGSFQVGDLRVRRGGTLVIDNSAGPVTLYVSGTFIMATGGSVRVADPEPEHFAVYLPGAQSVSLSGAGTSFYGVVYAPYSSISISGQGEFFGAFVGSSVVLQDRARVHYDSTLSSNVPAMSTGGPVVPTLTGTPAN